MKIDGPKEAKWTFDGKEFDSGSVVENVPTGKYVVSFTDVPEWTRPADAEVPLQRTGRRPWTANMSATWGPSP